MEDYRVLSEVSVVFGFSVSPLLNFEGDKLAGRMIVMSTETEVSVWLCRFTCNRSV